MAKKHYLVVAGLVIVVMVVIAGYSFMSSSNESSTDLQTVAVLRMDIGSHVLATGIIKPMVGAEVKVGSRISGVVKKLRANIGDKVEKGQIIAELNDAELKAKLSQNLAAVSKAESEREFAQANFERKKALAQQNLISREELDMAENSLKVAEAQVKLEKANADYARVQLSYTKIYAPISGVIGSISTQEGETVAASFSAPTFVTLIDLNRLEVYAFVDETDIGKIADGQSASFTVDTYPETDFYGEVTAIYPKAEIVDNVVNYIVTIRITNFQNKTLRPEMTTFVKIFLDKRENVLAVPSRAIKREQSDKIVYVLDGTEIIKRTVKTGFQAEGYTEIISGVKTGERVIISEIQEEIY